MNVSDIKRIIDEHTQESLYLEFKRGDALNRQNNSKCELIKDVTGFANADGGRIIYGVGDKKVGGIHVADKTYPVVDEGIDKEWISSVIRDNTSPRFHDFDVHELPFDEGRIIVINIQPARTAHQNLLDHRYYQRTGVVTSPINDFQIRDLMARTTRPLAEIFPKFEVLSQKSDFHRYVMAISVKNIGMVTMENWWFEIELPEEILNDTRSKNYCRMREHEMFSRMCKRITRSDGSIWMRISFGDPFLNGSRFILHPQQTQRFDAGGAVFPQFIVELNQHVYVTLNNEPALPWTLYLKNTSPIQGEIPFKDWCKY